MGDDRSRQSRGEESVTVSSRLDGALRIIGAVLRGLDFAGGGEPAAGVVERRIDLPGARACGRRCQRSAQLSCWPCRCRQRRCLLRTM